MKSRDPLGRHRPRQANPRGKRTRNRRSAVGPAAPIVLPRIDYGPSHRAGFDFTEHIRRLCGDMIVRLPELSHIVLEHVAVAFAQARNRSTYGLFATLTPLRFENGATVEKRQGKLYRVQPVIDAEGREMLYILTLYLPRFMDLDFREKLITILHELWHISPLFNGDLRRHPGRCYVHTHSQADYDEEMGRLADRWLLLGPPRATYHFLQFSFDELHQKHGRVYGVTIPHPKVTPFIE